MERMVANEEISYDEDASLRPSSLQEYIGQGQLKRKLSRLY